MEKPGFTTKSLIIPTALCMVGLISARFAFIDVRIDSTEIEISSKTSVLLFTIAGAALGAALTMILWKNARWGATLGGLAAGVSAGYFWIS